MNLIFIYGPFSTGVHGGFKIADLFSSRHRGLTGSESFFWHMVKQMASRGHHVRVFCQTNDPVDNAQHLNGASVYNLQTRFETIGVDAAVVWNEPDMLRPFSSSTLRICVQQLNDFVYCQDGYEAFVDMILCPSETHREYIKSIYGNLSGKKFGVLGNCIDLSMFASEVKRDPYKLVYCSSPDRGLHWALSMWPDIRSHVPQATLHIYYRVNNWLQNTLLIWKPNHVAAHRTGVRARYINEALGRLGTNGEFGVYVHEFVSNVEAIAALKSAKALLYPCDPVMFTEGFSVAILDACAAGAVPIISDVDALPEIYGSAALMIRGRPKDVQNVWIDNVVSVLTNRTLTDNCIANCKKLAELHTVEIKAALLEKIIAENRNTI
jgi:glycosyltransferase involved in cell wall biosynthesis